MTKQLPEKANIEQLKKQSKALLQGLRAKSDEAAFRIIKAHPSFQHKGTKEVEAYPWKIGDAQFVIAREYGFRSWERLKNEVERRVEDLFNVRAIVPLIPVSDIEVSLQFYERILGFECVDTATSNAGKLYWCLLKKDRTRIMIEEGRKDFIVSEDPIKLCFLTKDVDRVYDQLKANDLQVKEPYDASYGMRQIYLKDPDNHIIWFESPITDKKLKSYTD